MYAKCGSLADARASFDRLPRRDVFSWTPTLTAFAKNGHCRDARRWFTLMQQDGVRSEKVIFLVLLKCSSSSYILRAGLMLQSLAEESGLISELVVSNAIINMFGECGSPELSQVTFDVMEERTLIFWTSAIEAEAQNCFPERALHLFRLMQLEGGNAEYVKQFLLQYSLLSETKRGNPLADDRGLCLSKFPSRWSCSSLFSS